MDVKTKSEIRDEVEIKANEILTLLDGVSFKASVEAISKVCEFIMQQVINEEVYFKQEEIK